MEKVLLEIIQYPLIRAQEEFIIPSDRIYQPSEEEAKKISQYISIFKSIARDIEEGMNFQLISEIENALGRAYTFFFDKGVEIGNAYRENLEPNFEIDFDNVFTGVHGDNIPVELQRIVNSAIPKIFEIGINTIGFGIEKQIQNDLDNNTVIKTILTSALMFGLEFSIRIERSYSY